MQQSTVTTQHCYADITSTLNGVPQSNYVVDLTAVDFVQISPIVTDLAKPPEFAELSFSLRSGQCFSLPKVGMATANIVVAAWKQVKSQSWTK